MKKLLTGDCHLDNLYCLLDPTQFREIDFEADVVKAFSCLFPDYHIGVFAGSFFFEGQRRSADLAMISKRLSHWFVVEVELIGHSLEGHVLPQVRCFRYGDPESECIASLVRGFRGITRAQAEMIINNIPRYVAVVSNLPDPEWATALRALDVQHLILSVFQRADGRLAYEIDGQLIARSISLGYAKYSEIDRSLRIPANCGLETGSIQITDHFGNPAEWIVREEGGVFWISRVRGMPLIAHDSYVQIIRDEEGRVTLRVSSY